RRHPPRNRRKKRKNLHGTSFATRPTAAPPPAVHHPLGTILHLSHHSETAAASNSAERAGPHPGAQGLVRLNAATAGPDRIPGARSPAQPSAETASHHPTLTAPEVPINQMQPIGGEFIQSRSRRGVKVGDLAAGPPGIATITRPIDGAPSYSMTPTQRREEIVARMSPLKAPGLAA
ncbi:hypothetical protein MTO96_027655, partial [Rhipicephalus appendiculatus]